MEDGYNFKCLKEKTLTLSEAKKWEVARKEWSLVDIFEVEESQSCLCGHFPIIEICEIANRVTQKNAEVGNRCVRRFLGVRSDLIFAAIKRIREDMSKSLNADAIAFFEEHGLFNTWEYGFLQNTMKKRSLSPEQLKHRKRINEKVLAVIRQRGF